MPAPPVRCAHTGGGSFRGLCGVGQELDDDAAEPLGDVGADGVSESHGLL